MWVSAGLDVGGSDLSSCLGEGTVFDSGELGLAMQKEGCCGRTSAQCACPEAGMRLSIESESAAFRSPESRITRTNGNSSQPP